MDVPRDTVIGRSDQLVSLDDARRDAFTTQLATLEPPPPEMQQLLSAVSGNAQATDAFVSVIAGTISPNEFFDPQHLAEILGAAAH